VVIEEGTVLGGQHRLDEQVRDLFDFYRNAFFLAELGEQFPIGGVNP
jgi:hypothetical protein